MIYFHRLSKLQLMAASLIGSCLFFLPGAQAQNTPEEEGTVPNSTTNYFLDNFKVSLDAGHGFFSKGGKTSLNVGYHFLKYDTIQDGVANGKSVLVNAGKSLLSLGTGIQCEKITLIGNDQKTPLVSIPITLRWAGPDYFFNGNYTIFTASYNTKFFRKSSSLNPATPLPQKGFHSFSIDIGYLTPFGLYGRIGVDSPLNKYLIYFRSQNLKLVHTNRYWCVGIDITMLIRKLYGMSFREGPLIIL